MVDAVVSQTTERYGGLDLTVGPLGRTGSSPVLSIFKWG